MTDEVRHEIFKLHFHRKSINEIARQLGLHPHSVRWVLNRGGMLERERKKRRADGRREYKCSKCGELGHTKRSCGVER